MLKCCVMVVKCTIPPYVCCSVVALKWMCCWSKSLCLSFCVTYGLSSLLDESVGSRDVEYALQTGVGDLRAL